MSSTNHDSPARGLSWSWILLFSLVHIMPLGAIWTGVRPIDLIVCAGLYILRMFFITAGFHRYFAHRSYKLNRFWQFVMAFGGQTSAQRGVLWWAAHHRHHHRYSDMPQDIHSPLQGFWHSHCGWIFQKRNLPTEFSAIKDFARFPELRFIEKYHLIPAALLASALFYFGGASMLFTGFFLSTTLLYHGTFTINSLSHVFGRRRFVTRDTSRNNWLLALVTLGEGWHNNHHHYPSSARQGFYWYEVDGSWYGLEALRLLGIVKEIRYPTAEAKQKDLIRDGVSDIGMFSAYWTKAAAALESRKIATGALLEGPKAKTGAIVDAGKARAADLNEARRHALEKRKLAMETMMRSTRESAEEIVRLSRAPGLPTEPRH